MKSPFLLLLIRFCIVFNGIPPDIRLNIRHFHKKSSAAEKKTGHPRAGLHNAASVRKSLLRLVELDILQVDEQGSYHFANPFFREWLRRQ